MPLQALCLPSSHGCYLRCFSLVRSAIADKRVDLGTCQLRSSGWRCWDSTPALSSKNEPYIDHTTKSIRSSAGSLETSHVSSKVDVTKSRSDGDYDRQSARRCRWWSLFPFLVMSWHFQCNRHEMRFVNSIDINKDTSLVLILLIVLSTVAIPQLLLSHLDRLARRPCCEYVNI